MKKPEDAKIKQTDEDAAKKAKEDVDKKKIDDEAVKKAKEDADTKAEDDAAKKKTSPTWSRPQQTPDPVTLHAHSSGIAIPEW